MTTTPVPSALPEDFTINVNDLDRFQNSTNGTFQNRLGAIRKTLNGVISGAESSINSAVASLSATNPRGEWVQSMPYAIRDLVKNSGTWYICTSAHTSASSFAADASRWEVFQGLTSADISDIKKINATLVADAALKIRAGTAKIVCIGDSLTYGHDSISGGTIPPVPPHAFPHVPTPYPETLQAELNRIYAPASIVVVNQGFSGDTMEDSFSRWTVNQNADLAFIMLGTNDAKVTGISLADYTKYLCLIIERLNQWATGVVIMTSPSISQGQGATPVESYRFAASEVANQYGCPVFNSDSVGLNNSFYSIYSDSIHFNQAGYTLLGNTVASFILAGGLGSNENIISSRKTLLCGYESGFATNGTYSHNVNATTSQDFLLALAAGSDDQTSFAFYLDADAAYLGLMGRLSNGCEVIIDSNSIRSTGSGKGIPVQTSANYTVAGSNLQSNPTSNLMLGLVVGRGWHSLTITAPDVGSVTPAYTSAICISPCKQEECSTDVYRIENREFSVFDPDPQYASTPPSSSTAVFELDGAFFASTMIHDTKYYASGYTEISISHTIAGVMSFTRYIVRPSSPTTLQAVKIAEAGANPVFISSVTATSIKNNPMGVVTINLTRPIAGYMEMRIKAPEIPQLLNLAIM